jgi:hypothetical protein
MNRFALGFAAVTTSLFSTVAFAGPDWQEVGDAGSLIFDAQETTGAGPLNSISGTFSDGFLTPDYEDVYIVAITNPAAFNITVTSSVGALGIFVFNVATGQGIVGSLTGSIGNTATDSSGAVITTPGVYALAIAVNGRLPGTDSGQIFNFLSPGEVSGPDGVGGGLPLAGWSGTPAGSVSGEYAIELLGCATVRVPSPGALALLGATGLLCSRRRR